MTNAFRLTNVSKRYEHFAMEKINLCLPEGEIMGLIGVNGAGKSTLLRILAGLSLADSGEVQVLGLQLPADQVEIKRQIGLASEDMRLYGSQTLRWHMDFMAKVYGSWDEAYATKLLRRFDLNENQPVASFSHGQRVKGLLLLNFARRPRLLLLDEPTTGLDPVARAEVLDALSDVLLDGARSVLFSSHNAHDIERLADTITFIHGGRLIANLDTESYLSAWRRVLGHGTLADEVTDWPEVAQVRRSGATTEITFKSYGIALNERLAAQGFEIDAIYPMSLEEIFITTIRGAAQQ
ncbi:MAG: ABC transporter ATP-binding protein [Casimicrobium sp.]